MKFNEKLDKIQPYEPIKEEYRIRLDANESYFPANKRVLAKIRKAAAELDYNRYPNASCDALREAFAKCYRVKPDQVVCGNGSDELINLIVETFASKGDRIVTTELDFSMYAFYSSLAECKVLTAAKNEDLTVNVAEVVRMCRESEARILFFSNPCNPTSLMLDRKTVASLVSQIPKTLVVLDEAYMDFSTESFLGEVKKYDNLIVLKTLSKAFGMAAIRLGFSVSNRKIADYLRAAKSPYNVNSLTQEIGRIALSGRGVMEAAVEDILDEKRALYAGLKKIETEAKGDFTVYDGETNFVFVKTSKVKQIDTYLKKRGICVRSFEGFLRITTGSEEENAELLQCLEEVSGILWI